MRTIGILITALATLAICGEVFDIAFPTARWFFDSSMSMKSMTIRPPMSRMRSCREISSAASRLVLVAVVSMSPPRVARAELMSIETSASV
jgi:hypothetical protein